MFCWLASKAQDFLDLFKRYEVVVSNHGIGISPIRIRCWRLREAEVLRDYLEAVQLADIEIKDLTDVRE